jgi:hypothetical protein
MTSSSSARAAASECVAQKLEGHVVQVSSALTDHDDPARFPVDLKQPWLRRRRCADPAQRVRPVARWRRD